MPVVPNSRSLLKLKPENAPTVPPFVTEPHCETILKPQALLPFQIDRKKGKEEFRNWVSSLWFAPNKLAE